MIDGLKELGALGMKVPEQYGGLGLSQVYYNRALALGGLVPLVALARCCRRTSRSASPSRSCCSAPRSRSRSGCRRSRPTTSPRSCSPSPTSARTPRASARPPRRSRAATVINGRKLWATNGAIADVVVVMAKVPKHDGGRGGISAFVLDYDTDGVTVENRNAFMGLRGIENSVTLLEDVFVPEENLIGREGDGLKIALTTLNTGRLALPAICVGVSKWATKVAREWAAERVQWGQPVGKHDAVAQKIAFIAATAFGLEAMLDVSSRLADDKKSDIRIEAAIAKLYASEMGWKVVDELMQVRGGRGYETAESLKARGEKPIPVEQAMRDMRINRIFEGSTEIMHLLIAREAVDQHLEVAGEILEGDGGLKEKAGVARAGGEVLRQVAAAARGRRGPASRARTPSSATSPTHVRFVERASRKLARSTFYAMGRWQAGLEKKQACSGGSSTSAPSCSRSRRRRRTRRRWPRSTPSAPTRRSSWPTCSASRPAAASTTLFGAAVVQRRRRQLPRRAAGPRGPPHVARGGHPRPVGRRAADRRRHAVVRRRGARHGLDAEAPRPPHVRGTARASRRTRT